MQQVLKPNPAKQGGFTLVELAVVVVIIGVLAAFAVPRFMSSVERSKASEAFNYLSTVQSAQERYLERNGTYAADVTDLDTAMAAPEYFTVGTITAPEGYAGLDSGWELTLTRTGANAGFGEYTVSFNHNGFDPNNSTISPEIAPVNGASAN